MSGDLLTLRMMVVSASDSVRNLWREGAERASVPIEFDASEASDASSKLKTGGFDIVVFDAALPGSDRDNLIKGARSVAPMPLIAVSAPPGTGRVDAVESIFQTEEGGEG